MGGRDQEQTVGAMAMNLRRFAAWTASLMASQGPKSSTSGWRAAMRCNAMRSVDVQGEIDPGQWASQVRSRPSSRDCPIPTRFWVLRVTHSATSVQRIHRRPKGLGRSIFHSFSAYPALSIWEPLRHTAMGVGPIASRLTLSGTRSSTKVRY